MQCFFNNITDVQYYLVTVHHKYRQKGAVLQHL